MAQLTIRSIAASVLIILMPRAIDSCSFSDPVVLAFESRPDEPIEKYIGGDLGLVRPKFARSHLVVAYRYIIGRPLTKAERRGVAELMAERLPLPDPAPQVPDVVARDWITTRLEAVPDAPMSSQQAPWFAFRQESVWSFANQMDDAYITATATLRKRMSEFGAGSTPVRAWLTAQDTVFSETALPEPADPPLPPIIRKDRDYQIASALFYRGDYDKAHEKFLEIANDAESPWAPLGRYLAVRALVRDATLHAPDDNPYIEHLRYKPEPMVQAEREIREVLADPNLKSIHAAAKRLLNFIEIRLRPQEYAQRIAGVLARGASPSTIKNDLADYTVLLDDHYRPDDEMTDWIFTLQDGYADRPMWRYRLEPPKNKSLPHAIEKWQTRKSTLWLVPAIVWAQADDALTPALMKAAAEVGPESPAYVTVRYHRLRLLRDLHHDAQLRTEINDILKTRATMGPSTRNTLLELRLPLSASIDEFVRDAPREAAGYSLNEPLTQPFYYLGGDAVADINRTIPLDDLAAMAARPLPDRIPATMVVATWTRALILGRSDVVATMMRPLGEWHREIAEALMKYANATPRDRKYEAINILVHYPGLTPYVGGTDTRSGEKTEKLDDVPHDRYTHENWWCRDGSTFGETIYPRDRKSPPANTPEFAKTEQSRRQATEERNLLLAAGSGSTFVLHAVVEWANERPEDPRVPEALSTAIKTTQWACPDSQTRAAARAAFNLLHSNYAKTKWARETRYWYDGRMD